MKAPLDALISINSCVEDDFENQFQMNFTQNQQDKILIFFLLLKFVFLL